MHISKSNPIHQWLSVRGIAEVEETKKKGSNGQRIVTIALMRYALQKRPRRSSPTTLLPKL